MLRRAWRSHSPLPCAEFVIGRQTREAVPPFIMEKREFEIIAQDPSMRNDRGRVLTARIHLPMEELARGPMGYALQVVDYDASTGTMYQLSDPTGPVAAPTSMKALLSDPGFHAMNVYAVAMRTLLRFEFALGRRVGWGIHGHQLKVVPHAFEEANAFYSPDLEALLFGYTRGKPPTFLCLSHDVIAHETAHAALDGLRDKFMAPSSPDQAALHEAFADIVALLSVFALPEVLQQLVRPLQGDKTPDGFVRKSALSWGALEATALFGLADGMRTEAADVRVNALRRSILIEPDADILDQDEFKEEHRRGEVLVGAVMRTLLSAWEARIQSLGGPGADGLVDLALVAEQGADIADLLLTMAIRAIDYTPPIHIDFADYLSAMLTADAEVRSDDSRYDLRRHLLVPERRNAEAGGLALRRPADRPDRGVPARLAEPGPVEARRECVHPHRQRAAVHAGFAGRRVPDSRDGHRVRAVAEGHRGRAADVRHEGSQGNARRA